jgi:hypothetical protein
MYESGPRLLKEAQTRQHLRRNVASNSMHSTYGDATLDGSVQI